MFESNLPDEFVVTVPIRCISTTVGGLPQDPAADSQPRLLEDFGAIAARLRIDDMCSRRNPREVVHTVDDEYRSYINGTLTRQGDDPLKFWDVGSSAAMDLWYNG